MAAKLNVGFRWFILGWVICFVIACSYLGKKPATWREHVPATVCDYEVAIIYRASFRTDERFHESVQWQIDWLNNHNRKVFRLLYEYGFDMTRTLILKSAVIFHKEEINE